MARPCAVLCVGVLLLGTQLAAAEPQAGRGNQRPTAAAPQPQTPPSSLPQVSAVAVRVVGPGLGANGSELRPFNESPGTAIVLAVQASKGSGIVEIDSRGSKVESFTDDKGQSLLEEGRIGSFPKVAEDGSVAMVEVEVRARPSTGSAAVTAQGTLAIMLAAGSKPTRASAVKLESGQTFKVGTATLTVSEAKVEEESTRITFGLTRTMLTTIKEIRFLDAKGAPIEARRAGSGYMNEKANLDYEAKTKDKSVTIEFEMWQNPRVVKVPFNVQVGLGVAAGPRSSGSGDAQSAPKTEAAKVAKAPGPPPVITAGDGAASVEAVVTQMQTAAKAGKGAQLLAVIYPTDRQTYGQGVLMAMAFLPMSAMDNAAASEKLQKELDTFFAKHKLKPPFMREPDELFKGVDLPAFISESMLFLKSHAKKGEDPALPIPTGKAEDVKITGDEATAMLNGKDAKFARISGKWFIRLE
jgi:hypothetical protein